MILISCLIIIFVLCVLIRLYIGFSQPSIPWSVFEFSGFHQPSTTAVACTKDADCTFTNDKCFQNQCIKAETESCNSLSGMWVLDPQTKTLKCVCKNNEFVTQNQDGKSDCLIPVACGIYGKLKVLIPDTSYCECDQGFALDASTGLCVHLTDGAISASTPCPAHTLSTQSQEAKTYFTDHYLNQFGNHTKCVASPCKTNILNGKSIVHAALVPDGKDNFRCFCDASYGHFGIHLETQQYLKTKDGSVPNACGSIYETEPSKPRFNFSHYCYFYLSKFNQALAPQCFTSFYSLPPMGLVRSLQGKLTVTVNDIWPYVPGEFIFQQNADFVFKDRVTWYKKNHFFYTEEGSKYEGQKQVKIPECSQVPDTQHVHLEHQLLNAILREHFVCRYTGSDLQYKDTVIVNPHIVKLNNSIYFSTGYELYKSWSQWKIKPADWNKQLPVIDHTAQLLR